MRLNGGKLDDFINDNLPEGNGDYGYLRGFVYKSITPTYKKISNLTQEVNIT